MATIKVRGSNLYYEIAGNGEVPLLFMHGMCGGAWVWAEQVERLSDRFTCVSYDRRGHSRSSDGSGDQSGGAHAEDAADLIAALGIDQPVLVGSSGGAGVAVELLHRRPSVVRGAVLSEPPLLDLDPEAGRVLMAEIEAALGRVPANADAGARLEAFLSAVAQGMWPRLDEERKARYRENAELLQVTLEAGLSTLTTDDVARIEVPVVAIAGARSHPSAVAITRRLAESLPDGRLLVLERAGHATYVEQPEEFAAAVAEFAAGLAAGPAAAEPETADAYPRP